MSEIDTKIHFKDRLMALICHCSAMLTIIPLAGLLVPFILWQIFKGESQFTDHHGKEAFNFQMTLLLIRIPSYVLWVVGIGFVLTAIIELISIVFCLIAAARSFRAKDYQYPCRYRFIR